MKIVVKDKRHLISAAKKILTRAEDKKIIAFYGALGAGKTTLIKAVCMALGVKDLVTSPTFTLVNEYLTPERESLYHIDLYRIKNKYEVFDSGIEALLESGCLCLLEWPELIEEFLPEKSVRIKITVGKNNERILDIA